MQHLDLEQLARLVDEAPEPAEAEHLRGCLVCRRELAEMRAQTAALAGLGEIDPPAGAWDGLQARLMDEGLVRGAPAQRRVLMMYRPQARIAAAVALFLLGGAAGALLLGGRGGTGPVASVVEDEVPAAESVASPSPRRGLIGEPELIYVTDPEPSADGNGARLAANGGAEQASAPAAVPPRRTRPERATRAQADRAALDLLEAQAQYVDALQRVAAIADPASGNSPETRLAALDQLVRLTAAALERVPGDPVINGYHLAAVAERDALRREMARDAETTWF